MTQEEKLLLKDLSARLPYGVKLLCNGWDSDGGCEFSTVETLIGIDDRFIHTLWRNEKDKHSIEEPLSILDYKPFLRPRSSMTDEEREELRKEQIKDEQLFADCIINHPEMRGLTIPHFAADWCNKNHFDYRGLIEKNLAIAVTENNNPYKE